MMKKIKVLHVIGFLGKGGDTTAVLNILDFINKNNDNVSFDFLTYKGANEDVINQLRKKGHKIFLFNGDLFKIGFIKYSSNLIKILKKNHYDCIHFHISFQSFIGLIIAKFCGIHVRICHSHTTAIQRNCSNMKKNILLPICRFLINIFSTKKIACSKIAGEFLFGKNSKYEIIYNGVNIDELKNINTKDVNNIRKKYNIGLNTVVIGQVGRFDENKNQKFTIKLAENLKNDDYVFLIIGDGSSLKTIKKIVAEKKLTNVYFTGWIKNVNDYMFLFNYLLLPSKYGEGLPTVVIEQQIVNENSLCLVSNIVTEECNIGNVKLLDVNKINDWIELIKYKNSKYQKCNYYNFDINNTAKKWISIYK